MKYAADISACVGLTACSLTDIQSETIPNILILIMVLYSAITIGPDFLLRLFPAIAAALFLYCLKRFGIPMTGGGDLKLFAVMFGWYGWSGLMMIGVGLAVAVVLNIKKRKIKLAPYMLLGFLIVKINGGF